MKDRGFTLALLSNTNELHYTELYKTAGIFLQEFDRIFLSYEIGLAKPSVEVYNYILSELCVSPADVVFIDDSPENVRSADRIGIKAYLHSGSLLETIMTLFGVC